MMPRPPREAIVDRRLRPVGFGTIGPAAAAFQHVYNTADNAAIVLPLDTAHIGWQVGFDPLSRCSILNESDSSLSYEQVFSPLEYRSDTDAAAECAGLRTEGPCLAV